MTCWLFTKLRDAKSVKGSIGTVSESFVRKFIGKRKREKTAEQIFNSLIMQKI